MSKYEKLELEIITFAQEDVILTSGTNTDETQPIVLPPISMKES